MPLGENQDTPSKPTFADVSQLADKMFAKKTTATDIHSNVHEALLDHRDHIKRVSTQNKALETRTTHSALLHSALHSLLQVLECTQHSVHSKSCALECTQH